MDGTETTRDARFPPAFIDCWIGPDDCTTLFVIGHFTEGDNLHRIEVNDKDPYEPDKPIGSDEIEILRYLRVFAGASTVQ